MTTALDGIPHALLHNLKHNKVLHERIILLTIRIEDVPHQLQGVVVVLDDQNPACRHQLTASLGSFCSRGS